MSIFSTEYSCPNCHYNDLKIKPEFLKNTLDLLFILLSCKKCQGIFFPSIEVLKKIVATCDKHESSYKDYFVK